MWYMHQLSLEIPVKKFPFQICIGCCCTTDTAHSLSWAAHIYLYHRAALKIEMFSTDYWAHVNGVLECPKLHFLA